jgi:putative ABC transport system permease protein
MTVRLPRLPRLAHLSAPAPGVPVGRRLLFVERRRATLTVLGVATSLLLVLVLGGIFAGAVEQVTRYIRTSPADIFISQAGVRTMHMSASALGPETVSAAAAVPGVAWAAPIGFASGSIAGPQGRQLTYLIGYDTDTGRGGARLVDGRTPGPGEAVLDEEAAEQLGVSLGGRVTVMGTPLRVVGLSAGGTSITNTTTFVDRAEFERIHSDQTSYVLVRADDDRDPAAVAAGLRTALPEATVQTREEFAASEARVVTDMSADLLRLMSTIGLLIALAVIALGLMGATLSRLRDFAVLKALGSTTRRLVGAVVVQVLWTITLAVGVAVAAALVLAWLIPLAAPTVQIVVTVPAAARTTALALLVGLAAAVWPLRRIASVDAATAFRETR